MERGLDHLVYATPDLETSVEALAVRLGTRPVPGGAHPGWGTRNALIGLGTGVYLEIIGPDPAQPDPEGSRPFFIDDLTEPRLVTWAYRHPDPESVRAQLANTFGNVTGEQGVHLGRLRSMSRDEPGGGTLHWRLTDPSALPAGGIVPFVIDWGATPHPSSTLANECELLGLEARHPDAQELQALVHITRPLLGSSAVELSITVGSEPEIRARIRTPIGEIVLS